MPDRAFASEAGARLRAGRRKIGRASVSDCSTTRKPPAFFSSGGKDSDAWRILLHASCARMHMVVLYERLLRSVMVLGLSARSRRVFRQTAEGGGSSLPIPRTSADLSLRVAFSLLRDRMYFVAPCPPRPGADKGPFNFPLIT